jgi:dihydroxy-acid dehydratase
MGRETPVLVDLKPSGKHYMEHFHAAGGMATLLRELKPLLHLDALTVTGRTLGEEIEAPAPASRRTWCARSRIRSTRRAASRVLRGNLAPAARSSSSRPPTRS